MTCGKCDMETIEEILEFAISNEIAAAELYKDLAEKTESSAIKKSLLQFSDEERGHQKRLENIKTGNMDFQMKKQIADLKIGDYLVDVELKPGMSYQEILVFAMKKENEAGTPRLTASSMSAVKAPSTER